MVGRELELPRGTNQCLGDGCEDKDMSYTLTFSPMAIILKLPNPGHCSICGVNEFA